MALDVGTALREGFRRATARNGLLIMVAVLVIGVGSSVLSQTVFVALADAIAEATRQQGRTPPADPFGPTPLALPLPAWIAGLLLIGTWLAGQVVTVVAIRTFVSDVTDTIPAQFVHRRIVWVVANAVVGGIVVGVLVLVGFLLLVIPGVFLAVSFYFLTQVIAVEDESFVEAMQDSWALTTGNRMSVFLLASLLVGLSLVVALPSLLLGDIAPTIATMYGLLASAPVSVFGMAATSRAYVQLVEGGDDEEEIGALGPDELDHL